MVCWFFVLRKKNKQTTHFKCQEFLRKIKELECLLLQSLLDTFKYEQNVLKDIFSQCTTPKYLIDLTNHQTKSWAVHALTTMQVGLTGWLGMRTSHTHKEELLYHIYLKYLDTLTPYMCHTCPNIWTVQIYYLYLMYLGVTGSAANSVDPDRTPQNAASDQGLHCLPTPLSEYQVYTVKCDSPRSPHPFTSTKTYTLKLTI